MGLFDGRSYSYTEGASSSSRPHRGHSPARSTRSTGSKGFYARPAANRSSSSFFGGGGGGNNHRSSSASFFGGNFGGGSGSRSIFGGGGSGSSYYKRSPRQGYVSYLFHKLQRMLRELWYYAKRHPMKAFFAVVVPLLSAGGAIGGLMKQFGVRLPMEGMSSRGGGGYYGSSGYGGDRRGGGGGLMDNLGSVMQIARAFT